jgi:hypothetical protein
MLATSVIVIVLASITFGAPQGNPSSDGTPTFNSSVQASPLSSPAWQNITVACNSHVDSETGYTLLLRVAMTPNLDACVQDGPVAPGAEYPCTPFNQSQITAVNGQTYDICGPLGACATFMEIVNAASALQYKCLDSHGNVGGSADIGGGMSLNF